MRSDGRRCDDDRGIRQSRKTSLRLLFIRQPWLNVVTGSDDIVAGCTVSDHSVVLNATVASVCRYR